MVGRAVRLSDFRTTRRVLLLCSLAVVLLMRRSILTGKLARRGRHITREHSIDPFDWMRVADVMDKEVPAVPATMKLAELSDLIAAGDPALSRRQAVCLLGGQGKLAGIITRGDIVRALR